MKKSELKQIIKEEISRVLKENNSDAKRKLFMDTKPGDKLKYTGPDRRGFKSGEVYTVVGRKSNSMFEVTIILKSNDSNLKLAIPWKHTNFIEKVFNEDNSFKIFKSNVESELLNLVKSDKQSHPQSYWNEFFNSENFKDLLQFEYENRETPKQAAKSIYSIYR